MKTFRCETCNLLFKERQKLKKHELKHDKGALLDWC